MTDEDGNIHRNLVTITTLLPESEGSDETVEALEDAEQEAALETEEQQRAAADVLEQEAAAVEAGVIRDKEKTELLRLELMESSAGPLKDYLEQLAPDSLDQGPGTERELMNSCTKRPQAKDIVKGSLMSCWLLICRTDMQDVYCSSSGKIQMEV